MDHSHKMEGEKKANPFWQPILNGIASFSPSGQFQIHSKVRGREWGKEEDGRGGGGTKQGFRVRGWWRERDTYIKKRAI